MSDEGTTFPEECDHCGTSLGADVRCPTATVDGENGGLHISTFCSEECKSKWLDERGDEPTRG